jgi:hypothetical protein
MNLEELSKQEIIKEFREALFKEYIRLNGHPALEVIKVPDDDRDGEKLELNQNIQLDLENIIGTVPMGERNNIRIGKGCGFYGISRNHFSIKWVAASTWHLSDQGSIQGTWLNSEHIKDRRNIELQSGDIIHIGCLYDSSSTAYSFRFKSPISDDYYAFINHWSFIAKLERF